MDDDMRIEILPPASLDSETQAERLLRLAFADKARSIERVLKAGEAYRTSRPAVTTSALKAVTVEGEGAADRMEQRSLAFAERFQMAAFDDILSADAVVAKMRRSGCE